jgi:hypothetical protein
MSRAFTKEEVRNQFLDMVRAQVRFWQECADDRTEKEKISGVAFSILCLIDGVVGLFPGSDIVMRPHPEDESFHRERGENFIPDGLVINDDCQLHGLLREN